MSAKKTWQVKQPQMQIHGEDAPNFKHDQHSVHACSTQTAYVQQQSGQDIHGPISCISLEIVCTNCMYITAMPKACACMRNQLKWMGRAKLNHALSTCKGACGHTLSKSARAS